MAENYVVMKNLKKEPEKPIKVDPPAINGQKLYNQAIALFVAHNYKDALEMFTHFIQLSKNSDLYDINELYSYRAECFFHLKNYNKFRSDVHRIPKQLRTPNIKELIQQASRLLYITRANEALHKIRSYQKDASAIEVSLSILTSVLDIRPKPLMTFEEKRVTSNLLHSRALLNFQMRRYGQAIQDVYQNTQIIDGNPDFQDQRKLMYNEMAAYLKTVPKEKDLYMSFGGKTCDEFAEVKKCVKNSAKTEKKGFFAGFMGKNKEAPPA